MVEEPGTRAGERPAADENRRSGQEFAGVKGTMQHIDEPKLESDPQYRYEYLADFIGFGQEDARRIQAFAPHLGPRIPELVEQT